jgi:hypothetical protein
LICRQFFEGGNRIHYNRFVFGLPLEILPLSLAEVSVERALDEKTIVGAKVDSHSVLVDVVQVAARAQEMVDVVLEIASKIPVADEQMPYPQVTGVGLLRSAGIVAEEEDATMTAIRPSTRFLSCCRESALNAISSRLTYSTSCAELPC